MSRQADVALVTGELVISAAVAPFQGATAHLYLEDISYADAPAVVLADATIADLRHDPSATSDGDTVVPFALRARPSSPIARRNDYAVRAWVDRDSDGTTGPADLFSDQSYRVLTQGFGSTVTIRLGPD